MRCTMSWRALLVMAFALSAYGGGERDGVTLHLNVAGRELKLSDSIALEVQLRNMTEEPVAFWGELLWGYRGGLVLHVLRENGDEVPARPLVDESIVPSRLQDRTAYVTVQPAHTFGVVRIDRMAALVDGPGIYRLSVEYISPLPRNYIHVRNLWTREHGVIRSTEVRIAVTR